jgi:CBS domain-containing protein
MKVQDVMTSPAHSCTPDATLAAAAQAMQQYDCGALPVLDNAGRPVGILTDRDVCLAVAQRNRFPAAIRVREIMTHDPFTCAPATDLSYALKVMTACHIRRLPVVDPKGRLVGIVTASDIVSAIGDSPESGLPLLSGLAAVSRRRSQPGKPVETTSTH